jgi:hypothetical protein
MQFSGMNRRQVLCVIGSWGGLLAWSMPGCGSSNTTDELSPEAKKALMTRRGAVEKPYVKPDKSKAKGR